MAGRLHGLVIQHGPLDHYSFVVASVIAEDMHDAGDTALLTGGELARRTRLSRATVTRTVKALQGGGWIRYFPGRGQGVANRYQLRIEAFPEDCRESCVCGSRGATKGEERRDLVAPVEPPNSRYVLPQSQQTPLSGSRGATPPSSVGGPSDVGADLVAPVESLPIVVGVRTGPDDDEIRVALETFRVTPSKTLRTAIGNALDRGWTASAINHELRANTDVRNCRDVVAVLVRNVRDLPDRTSAPPRPVCDACSGSGWKDPDADTLERCPVCHPSREVGRASGAADEKKSGTPRREFAPRGLADPFKSRRKSG